MAIQSLFDCYFETKWLGAKASGCLHPTSGGGGDSDITRRAPDLPTSVGDNLNGYSPKRSAILAKQNWASSAG